jgi:tRNA G10  N-methylase Trm11
MTIFTAKVGDNSDLFPDVLSIFVPDGSRILDMTFANGVFWKKVDVSKYNLTTNDLFNEKASIHEDFRNTSFPEKEFDAVVLDPPYMRTNNKAGVMASNYNNQTINLKTHAAILQLYRDGIKEARRLLKYNGILIVKCQDEVESKKQKWTHIELMNSDGFIPEDLFVLVRNGGVLIRPTHKNQQHGRKNHSYFFNIAERQKWRKQLYITGK